jgi:hypothetical protein
MLSSKPKLIKDIKESDFKDLIPENQKKSKFLFHHDKRTWNGLSQSVKLPNDCYFYNQSNCDKSSGGEYLTNYKTSLITSISFLERMNSKQECSTPHGEIK